LLHPTERVLLVAPVVVVAIKVADSVHPVVLEVVADGLHGGVVDELGRTEAAPSKRGPALVGKVGVLVPLEASAVIRGGFVLLGAVLRELWRTGALLGGRLALLLLLFGVVLWESDWAGTALNCGHGLLLLVFSRASATLSGVLLLIGDVRERGRRWDLTRRGLLHLLL